MHTRFDTHNVTSTDFKLTPSIALLSLSAHPRACVQNVAEAWAFDSSKQITQKTKDLLVEFNGIEMSGWGI